MTLIAALVEYLATETGLPAYYLARPSQAVSAVVVHPLALGQHDFGLAHRPSLRRDRLSVVIYHQDPVAGQAQADTLRRTLPALRHETLNGYPVQKIEYDGGLDRPLLDSAGAQYQFTRDFTFHH